jgi:hypothetical protein
MHSIEDIYAIIHAAEKHEANGEYLLAYQTYMMAVNAVDNDDDSFPFAGINPAPYDAAQYYANRCCERLWNCLSAEEKAIASRQ